MDEYQKITFIQYCMHNFVVVVTNLPIFNFYTFYFSFATRCVFPRHAKPQFIHTTNATSNVNSLNRESKK